jgi:hypothetical protein
MEDTQPDGSQDESRATHAAHGLRFLEQLGHPLILQVVDRNRWTI